MVVSKETDTKNNLSENVCHTCSLAHGLGASALNLNTSLQKNI